MVKITFEVNEEYIRKKADIKSMLESDNGEKASFPRMMIQMIAFAGLERELDNGKTEFIVKQDELDEKLAELFDKTSDEICILAHLSQKSDEDNIQKDDKESKESKDDK